MRDSGCCRQMTCLSQQQQPLIVIFLYGLYVLKIAASHVHWVFQAEFTLSHLFLVH